MDFDLKHSLPDKDDPFLREIFHLCFHILPVMDTMPVRFLQSMICIERSVASQLCKLLLRQ